MSVAVDDDGSSRNETIKRDSTALCKGGLFVARDKVLGVLFRSEDGQDSAHSVKVVLSAVGDLSLTPVFSRHLLRKNLVVELREQYELLVGIIEQDETRSKVFHHSINRSLPVPNQIKVKGGG